MDEDAKEEESSARASLVRVLRLAALVASRLEKRDDATKLFEEATRVSANDPDEAVQLELAFTCAAQEKVEIVRDSQ